MCNLDGSSRSSGTGPARPFGVMSGSITIPKLGDPPLMTYSGHAKEGATTGRYTSSSSQSNAIFLASAPNSSMAWFVPEPQSGAPIISVRRYRVPRCQHCVNSNLEEHGWGVPQGSSLSNR